MWIHLSSSFRSFCAQIISTYFLHAIHHNPPLSPDWSQETHIRTRLQTPNTSKHLQTPSQTLAKLNRSNWMAQKMNSGSAVRRWILGPAKALRPSKTLIGFLINRVQGMNKQPYGLEAVPSFAGSHVKFIGKRSALSCLLPK